MQETTPWGLLTSLDLYDCNPETIRDSEKIKQYVIELCELIGIEPFGDCQVVHFGNEARVEGYSMAQFTTAFFQAEFITMHVIKRM